MSTTQNKAVLTRWTAAMNEHNVEKLDQLADELFTADCVLHDPDFADLPPGPEGVKLFLRRVLPNMPDMHLTIEDMIAEEDRVASHWTVHGTDLNQQKMVTLMILIISRFEDGKLAEEWELVRPVEG